MVCDNKVMCTWVVSQFNVRKEWTDTQKEVKLILFLRCPEWVSVAQYEKILDISTFIANVIKNSQWSPHAIFSNGEYI